MSEKPESLRLTEPEALRVADGLEGKHSIGYQPYAAAELRRLHAENERLRELLTEAAAIEPDCGCVGCSDKREALKVRIDAALRREET